MATNSIDSDEVAQFVLPQMDLPCLQIQLFLFLVHKVWMHDVFFLHTIQGYPSVLPGLTVFISPMLSYPGPDKNHLNLMHWLYRKSHIYVFRWRLFLQPMTSKNDVSLCKLAVNVKNRTAVAGSVSFFKLMFLGVPIYEHVVIKL